MDWSDIRQVSTGALADYFSNANPNHGERHERAKRNAGTGTQRSNTGICLRTEPD